MHAAHSICPNVCCRYPEFAQGIALWTGLLQSVSARVRGGFEVPMTAIGSVGEIRAPNGGGHLDEAVVQVGQQGGDDNANGGNIEHKKSNRKCS